MLSEIGSNLTIKDKKLNVINGKLVETITRFLLTSRKENPSFEPEFYQSNKGETEAFAPVFSTLLRTIESIRTWIRDNQDWYWVPKLDKVA